MNMQSYDAQVQSSDTIYIVIRKTTAMYYLMPVTPSTEIIVNFAVLCIVLTILLRIQTPIYG